jgi:hypothetical protein
MNCRFNLTGSMPAVACLLFLSLLITGTIKAQSMSNVGGELVSAGQATINGFPAISGSTVFNHNRIRTAKGGAAIINLGKFGRMRLEADTDLTLRLSTGRIGGDLHSGRTVVSAPVGIAVSISTISGMINTDGRQATALTIDVDSRQARVVAHQGEANLVSDGIVERIESGDEVILEPHPGRGQHRRLVATGSQAPGRFAGGGQLGSRVGGTRTGTGWELIPTFTGLINAAINYSMGQLMTGKDRNIDQYYNSTITCRDSYTIHCRRRGRFSP